VNGRPNNDPEIDALLGAYALDAVDDDERARVDAYLAVNPNARHEVDDLRESAAALALAPHDDVTAPTHLWDRISTTIGDQSRVVTPPRARRRPNAVTILAIAASIAVVVLAGAVVALSGRPTSSGNLAAVYDTTAGRTDARQIALRANGAEVARVVLLPDGTGYLKNESMHALAPGQTYQLWALTGVRSAPTAISAGVLGAHPQIVGFHAPASVHGLGVTVEQSPGVVQSRQPMYAAANFA
jgi:anti-sigma-K factor RskA